MIQHRNLFQDIPNNMIEEAIETLAGNADVRIERIISRGHVTPPETWYDQDHDEWVGLLTGAARIRIENDAALIALEPGDWLNLPAHLRHRVEWTADDQPTVWLAVHFRS
jgi:cupin 2 domain-containing protein